MKKLLYLLMLLTLFSCKKEVLKNTTRSFYLGVTPWPPDFTSKGYDLSYGFINNQCDMVSHHYDDGVAWEEAYSGLPMPQSLLDDVSRRKQKTSASKKVLLSMAALKISRKDRTGYYGSSSYAAAWAAKRFNDTTVITAYVKFVTYLATELHADYINFGVESNSGDWNAADFEEYKQFLNAVHTKLKMAFPNTPCFISFMVTPDVKFLNNAKALEPYTDWITLSAYPYSYIGSPVHGSSSPALIPGDLFQSFVNINAAKPCAFAETGYIAQDLEMLGVTKEGSVQWQEDYVNYLFDFCQKNKAKFAIWFCAYDYDAAINTFQAIGYTDQLANLWKDTGLYDETLAQRPALGVWKEWMKLPVVQ